MDREEGRAALLVGALVVFIVLLFGMLLDTAGGSPDAPAATATPPASILSGRTEGAPEETSSVAPRQHQAAPGLLPPVAGSGQPQPVSSAAWPPDGVSSMRGVLAVLAVAMANDRRAIVSSAAAMAAIPKPAPGDPAIAREKSEAGMNALAGAAYETAIARLEEGVRADPGDAALRNNLGRALMMFGKLDEAKQALVDSIALEPGRASAWTDLGIVLARESEEDLAAAAFVTSMAVSKPQDNAIDRVAAVARSADVASVMVAAARALDSPTVRDSAPTLTAPP